MHTPGPWKVYDAYEVVSKPGKVNFSCIATPERELVMVEHDGEIQAKKDDLHLIGTAPEMLLACKTAVHALRSYQYGNGSPDLAKEVADHIEEIIAKAESNHA